MSNSDSLSKEQIDAYIRDVATLGEGIIRIDNLLRDLEDETVRMKYRADLDELLQTFRDSEKELKTILQDYVKKEDKVYNFQYHKLLKQWNRS